MANLPQGRLQVEQRAIRVVCVCVGGDGNVLLKGRVRVCVNSWAAESGLPGYTGLAKGN